MSTPGQGSAKKPLSPAAERALAEAAARRAEAAAREEAATRPKEFRGRTARSRHGTATGKSTESRRISSHNPWQGGYSEAIT